MSTNTNDTNQHSDQRSTTSNLRKRIAVEDLRLWSRVLDRRKRQCTQLDDGVAHSLLQTVSEQAQGDTSTRTPRERAGSSDRLGDELTKYFERAADDDLPIDARRKSLETLEGLLTKVDRAVREQKRRSPPVRGVEPPTLVNTSAASSLTNHTATDTRSEKPSDPSQERSSSKEKRPSLRIHISNSTLGSSAKVSKSTAPAHDSSQHHGRGAPLTPSIRPETSSSQLKRKNGVTNPSLSSLTEKVSKTNEAVDASLNPTIRTVPLNGKKTPSNGTTPTRVNGSTATVGNTISPPPYSKSSRILTSPAAPTRRLSAPTDIASASAGHVVAPISKRSLPGATPDDKNINGTVAGRRHSNPTSNAHATMSVTQPAARVNNGSLSNSTGNVQAAEAGGATTNRLSVSGAGSASDPPTHSASSYASLASGPTPSYSRPGSSGVGDYNQKRLQQQRSPSTQTTSNTSQTQQPPSTVTPSSVRATQGDVEGEPSDMDISESSSPKQSSAKSLHARTEQPRALTPRPAERPNSTRSTSHGGPSTLPGSPLRHSPVMSMERAAVKNAMPRSTLQPTAQKKAKPVDPPSIATSLSVATFVAELKNSPYSGRINGRNTFKAAFYKQRPSPDMNQRMGKRLQRWDPYWQVVKVVCGGMTSPIVNAQPDLPKTAASWELQLPPDVISKITTWGQNMENPAHGAVRLIMRMIPVSAYSKKRADYHLWPKGTYLKINNDPMKISQRKQQSHDLSLWKSMCHPFDLTYPLRNPKRVASFEMCCYDEDQYFYCIAACQYRSPQSICKWLLQESCRPSGNGHLERLSLEESKERAMRRINQQMVVLDGDDENGQEDIGRFVFTLTCPISKQLMVTPVRGKNCKHWQCFDLEMYLSSNATVFGGRWRCASCETFVSYQDLQLCGLTEDALKRFKEEASPTRDRVEFTSNKSYRLLEKNKQRYRKRQTSTSASGGRSNDGNEARRQQNQEIAAIVID